VYKRRSRVTGKRMIYKEKLQTDGVLGLNGHPLSFPKQLYDKNKAENSILLCLAKTNSFFAGYIAFGFPLWKLGTNLPWVPLFKDKGYITIQDIHFWLPSKNLTKYHFMNYIGFQCNFTFIYASSSNRF